MSTPTWGLDPKSRRISVYYFGTSTIYEGMPVCYDNSTTNWLGVSSIDFTTTASSITEATTTAEGSQNEGKFIRVENPNADNISLFAGVVAGADHAGETGPRAIDIYIPNGAIVPVRTDNNCLIDQTILAITTASQELGVPLATDSRPVAIARETIDRGTAGLVLAELNPDKFLHQDMGGTAFSVDDADAGTASIVNKIHVNFLQTTGNATALWVQATTANGTPSTGYGLSLYAQADVTGGTVATSLAGAGIWLNLTGGTIGEYVCALEIGLYEDGCTMTGNGRTSILTLSAQMADAVTNGYSWVYMAQNGAVAPDYLFETNGVGTWSDYVSTGDAPVLATGDLMIPIRVGGATYYLVGFVDTGV